MLKIITKAWLKYARKPIGIVALSFGLIPFMGPKQQSFAFNWAKTINFIQPGEKWPVEKFLTEQEKQVYQQLGKPDMFRVFWDTRGEIRVRETVEQEWGKKGPKSFPPLSWVYLQRNEEVIFANGSYFTQPLSETTLLVVKYGDPENVKDIGNGVTQWMYYGVGKQFVISGNKVISTKDFPAMGSWHK